MKATLTALATAVLLTLPPAIAAGETTDSGLGFLVLNSCTSQSCDEFARRVAARWQPPPGVPQHIIMITEQSPVRGSAPISVLYNDQLVAQTSLGPRMIDLDGLAQQAVRRLENHILTLPVANLAASSTSGAQPNN